MPTSYYDLLGVAPTAPLDEIKKAFRREIAKYHPDKVQHLGREFQEIASVKAAELTRAYKTLCDESLRADYDAGLAGGGDPAARDADARRARAAPAPSAAGPTMAADDRPAGDAGFAADRRGAGDLLRKATLARFRQALGAEFGRCDEAPAPGFDLACAPLKGRFWSKPQPRILVRVVPHVDGGAIAETWGMAARLPRDKNGERAVCIFLLGPAVAPAGELARAIAAEQRKPAAHKLFLVPLNMRSWAAHIPADAPAAVKALVGRLKST